MTTKQKAKDGASSEASATDTADVQYLKYTGASGVRIVSKADWKSIGIDHEDVSFDASNGWMVKLDDVSEEALNYFLSVDGEFKSEKSAKSRALAAGIADEPMTGLPEDVSGGFHAETGTTLGGSTAGGAMI